MMHDRELPQGWAEATIGDLIASEGIFCDGDWIETEDQDPQGDVRLIQLADVGDGTYRNKSQRYLTSQRAHELNCTFLKPGDVLIARMPDPLGRACIFPGDDKPSITAVDVCIARTGTVDVDHRWLQWFINSPRFRGQIAGLQSGSTRKRISRKNLGTLLLPVPPRDEQFRISEKIEELFSDLDAGVAALERVRLNLKRFRTAVLKAAVEGRLTEEWRRQTPPHEDGSKLLERILMERRQKWEIAQREKCRESGRTLPKNWQEKYALPEVPRFNGLPALPATWTWTSLGQCFEVHVGATPSRAKPTYWNGKIPWVSSGEVQFCRIGATRESITEEGLKNSSTQINPSGSVLLGMIGEGRTRGQVAILDIDACNNQNCAAIWVSRTPISPEWVYIWLWSQYEVTRRRGSGNNQPALNKTRVEQIPLPLPSLEEQQQIVLEVERRLSVVEAVEVEVAHGLKRSARLRQAVLKRAFDGELVPQDPADEPALAVLARIKPAVPATAPNRPKVEA